jgi:hypothetical protein
MAKTTEWIRASCDESRAVGIQPLMWPSTRLESVQVVFTMLVCKQPQDLVICWQQALEDAMKSAVSGGRFPRETAVAQRHLR